MSRSGGSDASRALALLLMTATHTLRVASPTTHSDLSQWLMYLEPITPTLFALLAGAGLAASALHRPRSQWRSRHVLRGLALIALSWLLFLPYHGPQWPASLVSTGILQALGTGIILTACIGSSIGTGIASVALLGCWTWMEHLGIHIDGLNQGSFPIFPFVPMVLIGHSWTSLSQGREGLRSALSVAAVVVVAVFAVSPGFREVWGPWGMTTTKQVFQVSQHGHGALALLQDLAQGTPTVSKTMTFWHTRPHLVPLLIALASLVIVFFRHVSTHIPSDIRALSLLGRHSLGYYLGQFLGLGALALLPAAWRHGNWTWLVATLSMGLIGISLSFWRERIARGVSP
ncbi:MAG: DUF1624 domain-containing protein [Fibrobacteria bacterium]|nr:DUF1624 domain-containing protein [Fibrobacteria bacterium]